MWSSEYAAEGGERRRCPSVLRIVDALVGLMAAGCEACVRLACDMLRVARLFSVGGCAGASACRCVGWLVLARHASVVLRVVASLVVASDAGCSNTCSCSLCAGVWACCSESWSSKQGIGEAGLSVFALPGVVKVVKRRGGGSDADVVVPSSRSQRLVVSAFARVTRVVVAVSPAAVVGVSLQYLSIVVLQSRGRAWVSACRRARARSQSRIVCGGLTSKLGRVCAHEDDTGAQTSCARFSPSRASE